MKIKSLLVILLLISLMVSVHEVTAGGKRVGSAAGIELIIPMGAQNVGIGGSNVANVNGMEAMYWNPAGLSQVRGVQAGFNYMTYFADMKISYFAVATNVGKLGVVGFSLQAMDIGDIAVTTVESPEGTGEIFTPTFMTLNASYSRAFTDRINFGLNFKMISEKVEDMTASAIAFDFGLQYRSPFGIDFGVVMRNYGTNMKFDGTSIEFDSEVPWANPNATTRKTRLDMASNELPTSLALGVAYHYDINELHGLNVSGLFSNNNFNLDQMNVGLEYNFKKMFFVRGGYNMAFYPETYPEEAQEYQYGLHFGFGVHVPLGERTIMVDYAFRDMDLFDANHYVGLTFDL